MSADSINKRLRYALPIRGYSQTRFLPVFNEHLQRIAPHAKPIGAGTLSRICTGQRHLYDYEILAFGVGCPSALSTSGRTSLFARR